MTPLEPLLMIVEIIRSSSFLRQFFKNLGMAIFLILGITVPIFSVALMVAALPAGSLGWFLIGATLLVLSIALVATLIQRNFEL